MNRLSIGSGRDTVQRARDGWVTLDPDPQACAEIVAAVPPLPPSVTAVSWRYIEMIHVIEHLYYRDAVQLVSQCHDALEPGGMLIMEQPNLEYAAKALLGLVDTPQSPRPFHDMFAIYGHQNGNPHYQHLWGYTPDSMTQMLIGAGFLPENIHIKPAIYHWPWRDFRVEAMR